MPKIIEHITSIINNYPVKEIIFYEYRAIGNFKPGSDTDLLKIENQSLIDHKGSVFEINFDTVNITCLQKKTKK